MKMNDKSAMEVGTIIGEAVVRFIQSIIETRAKNRTLNLDLDKTELTFVADYIDKNDN